MVGGEVADGSRIEAETQHVAGVGQCSGAAATQTHGGRLAVAESADGVVGPTRIVLTSGEAVADARTFADAVGTATTVAAAPGSTAGGATGVHDGFGAFLLGRLVLKTFAFGSCFGIGFVVGRVTGTEDVLDAVPGAAPEALVLQVVVGLGRQIGAVLFVVEVDLFLHQTDGRVDVGILLVVADGLVERHGDLLEQVEAGHFGHDVRQHCEHTAHAGGRADGTEDAADDGHLGVDVGLVDVEELFGEDEPLNGVAGDDDTRDDVDGRHGVRCDLGTGLTECCGQLADPRGLDTGLDDVVGRLRQELGQRHAGVLGHLGGDRRLEGLGEHGERLLQEGCSCRGRGADELATGHHLGRSRNDLGSGAATGECQTGGE